MPLGSGRDDGSRIAGKPPGLDRVGRGPEREREIEFLRDVRRKLQLEMFGAVSEKRPLERCVEVRRIWP